MKKLLVTAIGAAAAFGAFADYTNAQRFEGMTVGPTDVTTLGSYWSELPNSTNTYAIVEMDAGGQTINHPDAFKNETDPANALSVKTTFGKPLSFNVLAGGAATNLESNLFFDSLVKFTVCEDVPADSYANAKIIMWLQEAQDASGNATGTNLMVRAGYLADGGVVATNYTCGNTISADFADKWHRVTIKAMPTISKSAVVPGFAIFIDGGNNTMEASSDDSKWDTAPDLTEAAEHYGETKLFPSLIQDSDDTTKLTLTSASFDGTGTLNDMVFTSVTPGFTEAEDYVAPKASVTIGDDTEEFTTLNAAIAALNAKTAEEATTVTLKLMKGMDLDDASIAIENTDEEIEVVIDLYGCGITNSVGATLSINSPVTIIDTSANQTGEIVMTGNRDDDCAILVGESGNLTLTAGTIVGYMAKVDPENSKITVSGGTINQDDGYELAEGKVAVDSSRGEGFYNIVDAPTGVAQIGESIYDTLAEALTAATAGQTIKLLDDVEATAAVSTAAGTLDLNGKTLTLPQDANKVATLTFTGAGAATLKGGDLMGVYHELTITTLGNEGLTLDGMTFHASVKPVGTNGLFKATNCQFLCDFDKTGAAFTDASSADVHSYGVMFQTDYSLFTQADIVNSYFDQGRRAAVQASIAGDLYFYGNTVVADKLTSRVDGAGTRYPALQIISNGRVFIENNTFSGQYLGEAFCVYNKGTYRTTDKAIVFSGNTVSNGVNYLWGIYDVDASGSAPLVNPDLYFGANTVGDQVNLTGCIYKTTVDGVDMNGVTYSHTPATLALPNGVASVYAWTHAAGATDYYVNGTAAADLTTVAANDTVIAVPGAEIVEPAAVILTADATLKNQFTAGAAVAQITGGAKYATLKEAVDAASAGDTVTVLADCTESGMVTFNSGITISNNYTVALTGMYALRFANGNTPVTICGSGTLAGSGTGSPLLIGSNETTKDAKYLITTTYEGSVILDGNTITYSGSGNVIKVEYGTFTMNSGTVTAGGNRGVKADADVGNFTSTVIINGGAITSTKAAVAASADTGTAVATINGGDITGPLTCGQKTGTATLTIPGTSTAKFSVDQSSFCETGYETTQSGDWYVVTKVKPSVDPIDTTTGGTAEYADASAATAAAAAINADKATLINVADAVTGEAKSAYLSKVEAVADGTTVTIQFTATAAEEAQAQADADNASLPLADIAAAESSADATIAATPGFYYTVESGTEPGNLTPGTPVLATGNTVKLSIPNKGAAGFYKIKVSPTK